MRTILTVILAFCFLTSCTTSIGKIQYEDLIIEPAQTIPSQLDEISGLQYQDGVYYGFNDSGGDPSIYTFTAENLAELKTIALEDAQNIDWEDIAMSDSLIFIGDFGNNIGNRKDQTIYIVKRDRIDSSLMDQKVPARAIQFFYPEQKNYDKQPYQHDFDMESMVYFDDELHLFTKEWKSEKTHHFTLDLVKGVQPAWLLENFDLGFLATGADVIKLNKFKSRLAIVGYNRDGEVFLMLTDFRNKSEKWLNNPKAIIKIGVADDLGQVEGVAFKNPNEFCISAEAIHSDLGNKEQNIRCFKLK
ncbi:MAG: hypothetical protein ACR2MS_00760 [Weeksellaceae bacterium]